MQLQKIQDKAIFDGVYCQHKIIQARQEHENISPPNKMADLGLFG